MSHWSQTPLFYGIFENLNGVCPFKFSTIIRQNMTCCMLSIDIFLLLLNLIMVFLTFKELALDGQKS